MNNESKQKQKAANSFPRQNSCAPESAPFISRHPASRPTEIWRLKFLKPIRQQAAIFNQSATIPRSRHRVCHILKISTAVQWTPTVNSRFSRENITQKVNGKCLFLIIIISHVVSRALTTFPARLYYSSPRFLNFSKNR